MGTDPQFVPKSTAWSWIAPAVVAVLLVGAAIAFALWRKSSASPLWYPLIPLS